MSATAEELKQLNDQYGDYFTKTFMDTENGRDMEKKKAVLLALRDGKKPPQIPGYNDIFDKEDPVPEDLASLFVK